MAWWKQYPKVESRSRRQPTAADRPDPRLAVGALVRLRGKPALVRRVLRIEWHRHRYAYVYIVETSAPPTMAPYWFAEQLEPVG